MQLDPLPPGAIISAAFDAVAMHGTVMPPAVLARLQEAIRTDDAAEVCVHGAQALYAHRAVLTPELKQLGAQLAHQAHTWKWYGFGKSPDAPAIRNAFLRDIAEPHETDMGAEADPLPMAAYLPATEPALLPAI